MTQDGRNCATNKLVASVKYIWVLATPLSVDLGVGYTRLTEDAQSLAETEGRLCWISEGGQERLYGLGLRDIRTQEEK